MLKKLRILQHIKDTFNSLRANKQNKTGSYK